MKKITQDHYTFHVNIKLTQELYLEISKLSVDTSKMIPELTLFLESFGIDINIPIRYDLGQYSDMVYDVVGTFSRESIHEIDFRYQHQFAQVAIYEETKHRFSLSVFGLNVSP